MADTITPNYHWTKPEPSSSPTTWGTKVNSDLDSIDATVFSVSTAATAAAAAAGVAQTTANAALPIAGGVMTGALAPSPTAGLTGTTTNNNANAGAIGEYLFVVSTSDTAMITDTPVNCLSLSLSPGDWDVDGTGAIEFSTFGVDALCALSLTSATIPTSTGAVPGYAEVAGQQIYFVQLATGPLRVSIAVTTLVYLVVQAEFSTGTCLGSGFIRARRVR